MSTHADFYIVGFWEHLGDDVSDLPVSWATFKGNESSVKEFYIDDDPLEWDKYLLMQVFDVENYNHVIRINGVDLAGIDMPVAGPYMWNVVLDWIDAPLHRGVNTIQIIRASGGDNFVIGNVVIHWRESTPVPFVFRWFRALLRFLRLDGGIRLRRISPPRRIPGDLTTRLREKQSRRPRAPA